MQQQPGSKSPFAAEAGESQEKKSSQRRAPQFGLSWMMLVLTVVTAAAAPLAYLSRGLRGSRSSLFIFILFCLAAPPIVLILVSAVHRLLTRLNRPKGK